MIFFAKAKENNLDITDIQIKKIDNGSNLKGSVTITISNCFVIHDLKIIEGKKGLFVAMPSKKLATGEYHDIVHPIETETRKKLNNLILSKYLQED